ncbi:hypothetical protein HYH96_17180 [Clostridium botulinum]|uniref:Uncharacterized protein n=1 Tax=Clostridium botulinum (strain Okra / Type B1) TaxID=498213 RepID=B1INU8_CLOBK|nr:hypothetical protein [Clostridium botulinum]ACA47110.1 hypothetical protein CLD_A0121 [Clostridium botulinum B1 str. Okra]MBD5580878.1 hypothetical protein [Clostridium botulinum]MBD5592989.1 hypothetical protein [Clostridium botulinum]MBD5625281.1 hypothetical protein [Clostridium botulinum]MBD5631189.1 hypothetical protein [Clostridium botulinum]
MNKYKRGQLVRLNIEARTVDGVIVRASGTEGKVVGRYFNKDGFFILDGELIDRFDTESLTNIILKQVREVLPLEDYLESEDIENIQENIQEWLHEFR